MLFYWEADILTEIDKFNWDDSLLLCWSFNIQKALNEYFKTHTYITKKEFENLVESILNIMDIPGDVLKEHGIGEENEAKTT